MALDTLDAIVAALPGAQKLVWNKANVTAVAGRPCSLWTPNGQPGAGSTTLGQAAAGAVPTDASTGAMPFTNPGAGNSYIDKIAGQSAASGLLVLYDALWVWGSGGSGWSVTTTTAQNTTSPAALTRPDANGASVQAFLEVLATMGAGAATPQLSYTDQDGNTGNTTTGMNPAYASAAIIGSTFEFQLAAGDTGVRTVQSLTLNTSMTSGTSRILLARRVCEVPTEANRPFLLDAFQLGHPRVYDDACLFWIFYPNSTASGPLNLCAYLTQG